MTPPVPPDKIASVLRQFFAGLSVPDTQADATAVQHPFMQPSAAPSIGAAAPRPLPQPMGGALGALMSAGPIVERGMRALRDHPLATAAEATGVPSLARGARDQDLGEMLRGAVQAAPFLGMAGKGAAALAPAAAEEAAPAMLSGDQLGQWRGIESFLNSRNAANVAGRAARGARAATQLAPRLTPIENAAVRPGADAEMLRNMFESGFAGGKSGTMVELPSAGAGRAGSTATAMAAARKVVPPEQLRGLVRDEIARRGGATSPEVEMAATEEVARRLASGWKPQGIMSTMADSVGARGVAMSIDDRLAALKQRMASGEVAAPTGRMRDPIESYSALMDLRDKDLSLVNMRDNMTKQQAAERAEMVRHHLKVLDENPEMDMLDAPRRYQLDRHLNDLDWRMRHLFPIDRR